MAALSEIKRLVSRRLDMESSSRLYRQLYDRLRWAILTGNLAPGSKVPVSPWPTGISWSRDWDDDDEDWGQTASWECPAGCSITWEDW